LSFFKQKPILKLIVVGLIAILLVGGAFYGRAIDDYFTAAVIIGDGDSLMAGGGDQLEIVAKRLQERYGERWYAANVAIGGQTVSQIVDARLAGSPRFKLSSAKHIVWLIGGTNDLAASRGGAEAVDKLLLDVEMYFRNLHERGYKVDECFYTDILPRSGTPNPTFEQDRVVFNSRVADRLKGLAKVIPSGENPLLQNTSDLHYYYDGTHLTGYGSALLADDAISVMFGAK
jgi:hypothetical protein